MSLRLGFLCDPFATLVRGRDSTLELISEARLRGHSAWVFEQRDLLASSRGAWVRARSVDAAATLATSAASLCPLDGFDALLLRKDPPVDLEFIQASMLAGLARGPLLVNDPMALRDCNEKLFALQFPELIPPTLIASDPAALHTQLHEWAEGAVLKPLDGHGGRGIVVTSRRDRNLDALLELYTARGTKPALVQAYLPEVRLGDKRILMVDGEPRGAFLRVPPPHGNRCNLAAGGTAAPTELTARDLSICERVGPALRARGLLLVGLDVIGRHLVEINVTSPGGLVDAAALGGARVAAEVIELIERKQRARAGGPSSTPAARGSSAGCGAAGQNRMPG
jgi:glutathione synthase